MSHFGTYDNMLKPLLPGPGFPWLMHKCRDPNCCLRKFWCMELRRMGFGCKLPRDNDTSDDESEKEGRKEEKTATGYAASSSRRVKKAPAKAKRRVR